MHGADFLPVVIRKCQAENLHISFYCCIFVPEIEVVSGFFFVGCTFICFTFMKNLSFLWLIVSLFLLAVPAVQTSADDDEVEIELLEVSGFLPGDNPLDGPSQGIPNPTDPTQFHATIAGGNLSVIVENTNSVQMTVRNANGNTVVNRQFVGGAMEQLPAGTYSIELNSGSLTLVGAFVAW